MAIVNFPDVEQNKFYENDKINFKTFLYFF